MQDQRDYYRDLAHRNQQKFHNVKKSRNEMIAINADLRDEVETLRALLDIDEPISEKESA